MKLTSKYLEHKSLFKFAILLLSIAFARCAFSIDQCSIEMLKTGRNKCFVKKNANLIKQCGSEKEFSADWFSANIARFNKILKDFDNKQYR